MNIRSASAADAEPLARIYNHYVAATIVTFDEEPVAADHIASRIDESQFNELPWLVIESDGDICGYAHASRWHGRCAYRYALETTVYLHPECTGRGLGSQLYSRLLEDLRERNFHTALGGIALPNEASVALHEKLGFRKVAHFEQVGFKFGRWIDVGYWQCALAGDSAAVKRGTRR